MAYNDTDIIYELMKRKTCTSKSTKNSKDTKIPSGTEGPCYLQQLPLMIVVVKAATECGYYDVLEDNRKRGRKLCALKFSVSFKGRLP